MQNHGGSYVLQDGVRVLKERTGYTPEKSQAESKPVKTSKSKKDDK